MDSLFLLSTPSQAFFLSHTPELVNNSILVITAKNKDEAKKIRSYVKNLKWKKIHIWFVLKGNNKVDHFNLLKIKWKIFKFKLKYSSFRNIYIGSYHNLIHLSLVGDYENTCDCKIFLLYDGLQMISVNATRNEQIGENIRTFPRLYEYIGYKRPRIEELIYISPVALEISGKDKVVLIKNRNPVSGKEYDEKSIYFIGQPLSIINLVTAEFYLESLKRFKAFAEDFNIIYFPHPRENPKDLEKIKMIFEIGETDLVFEEYFLKNKKFSGTVVSFYSSVLVNLIFFKADIKCISLEIPKDEMKSYQDYISTIYKYFHKISSEQFEVLKIDNLNKEKSQINILKSN